MLLDFVTFRLTTDHGARRTECLGHAGDELVPGKFCDSNSKLGKGLMSFDMSPGVSCPGSKNAICRELRPDGKADEKPICWAFRKGYRQENRKARLATNLQFSRTDAFVPWANGVISRRHNVKAVRLPGIGDQYSPEFVRKVRSIIEANPKMLFWFYTRSWVVPNIWQELETLKAALNLTMWLSWDSKMAKHHGPPPDREVPWCWLATDDNDLPPEPVDLVWRYDGHLQWNQSLPEKHVLGGCVVCPHETGVASKVTCGTCQICWRDEKFRTAKISRLLDKYKE